MDTNEIAVKGIIILGVVSVLMGGILAAMGKVDSVITVFVVIGSNALSALAGYMTGQMKQSASPNDQGAEAPQSKGE